MNGLTSLLILSGMSLLIWRIHITASRRLRAAAAREKKLEEDYRQLQAALEKTEKELKDKDRFFFLLAHNLRGPAASTLMLVQLLENKIFEKPADEQKKVYGLLLDNMEGTSKLLENLLLWSRFRMGTVHLHFSQLNLYDIINTHIQPLLESARQSGITIENAVPEYLHLNGDHKMLSILFKKLITNACRFTVKNGVVRISVQLIKENLMSGELAIFIEDSGLGMNPNILEKLFNPYDKITFPDKHKESGTGLGLVICREIVEMHQGVITVESTPGKGSRFIVVLPL